jgi:hypothetical protein
VAAAGDDAGDDAIDDGRSPTDPDPERAVVEEVGLAVRGTDLILPGRADPLILLSLRCLRFSFHPLLWGGAAFAIARGVATERLGQGLDSPSEIYEALRTPLFGIVLAVGARFLASGLAMLASYPLALRNIRAHYGRVPWRPSTVPDVVHLIGAYKAARWTRVATEYAVEQVGPLGRVLNLVAIGLGVLGAVLFVVFLVTAVVAAGA